MIISNYQNNVLATISQLLHKVSSYTVQSPIVR